MKIKCLLIILLLNFSCDSPKVMLYYYNGLDVNKNNTWGSSLQIFFVENRDMVKTSIRDKGFENEISMIKEKIISTNNIITPDDGNYTFAFINKKDTLFADDRLEFWRYGDRGVWFKLNDVTKKTILKHYKLNSNQW